jgi:DNA-binding winged helix-turn-helix (wHTH) protein/predicted ATPase
LIAFDGVLEQKDLGMQQEEYIVFGPFRFGLTTERLWREEREIPLRARAKAVLRYLVTHPGRVIPREEFGQHVWAETQVSKTALRICLWEIRQALGDQAATPQYIETVGRQGYRFVAQMAAPGADSSAPPSPFVGRQAELASLQACLVQAQQGHPHLVLVTGDAGVGKTTLVQQFLAHVQTSGAVWVGQGQCIEHAGPGEAYLPLLEALGRCGHAPEGEQLLLALRRAAPTWLMHLPLLREAHERDMEPGQGYGASRESMLRELVEALSLGTAAHSLVLVLEDLQWSDASTVEFLAYVARRTDRLRLLVLGTYRPAEVIAGGHPLRQMVQELVAHRLCQELRLELLTVPEVEAYVAQRLGASPVIAHLGALIHQRTDGNALFMVHVLDYLLAHGLLLQVGGQWRLHDDVHTLDEVLPDSLRALIGRQVEAVAPETQQCLAVASVAGVQFTAAEVAAGLQCPIEDVEGLCDGLCQQGQFLVAHEVVEWPDGTVTVQYGFGHALYHAVVYGRLGLARRVRLHRLLGEWLERAYRERAHEIASTLALHFTHGRDGARAVHYRQQAAERAVQHGAYAEALVHCQQGLALLEGLPETAQRQRQELALQTCFSTVVTATHGRASPELEQSLQRVQTLCQALDVTAEHVPVLIRLLRLSMVRADRGTTEALLAQARCLLEECHEAGLLVQLHTQLGTVETFGGAHARAAAHQTQALRLYDREAHRALVVAFGLDPLVATLVMAGWRLWLTGWPAQAWQHAERAIQHAEILAQPFSLSVALSQAVALRQFRREYAAAWALGQRLSALGREHRFGVYEAVGGIYQGHVFVQRGELEHGKALLTTGLAQYRARSTPILLPFFLSFLATAALRQGQIAEGLHVIDEALRLTRTHFDRFWEAELHRLRGELLWWQAGNTACGTDPGIAAAACFQQALAIARQQGAKALELRAALSLSRLWQQQDKSAEASALLGPLYGWFTEGFDTADLQEAKALLDELGGEVR